MSSCSWFTSLALGSILLSVGCVSSDSLKHVEDEIADLKLEVFKVRSQLEALNAKIDVECAASSEKRKQDKSFQADLQEIVSQIQKNTTVFNNQLNDLRYKTNLKPTPTQNSNSDDANTNSGGTSDKVLAAAILDYNRGNYDIAAEALSLFIKENQKSSQCADACFYLGLCLYNQKLFDKAKAVFDQIISEYPNSIQFVPAKLKRGQCLNKMGMKPAAIKTFKEIVSDFSNLPEAHTAQQELADLGF